MTDANVIYLAIQDARTKKVVFGYPIADYLTLENVVVLDTFVRTKVNGLFAGYDIRANRVQRGPLHSAFSGLVCKVAEDPASYEPLYEVHVVSIDELARGPKSRDHLIQRDASWWRNENHKVGGWEDRAAAAEGRLVQSPPETEDQVASRNFWSAFKDAFVLVFLMLITFGTVKTFVDSFTDD